MIIALNKAYASRAGIPVIERVDSAIFEKTYFGHCMQCGFCGDSCCQYGVDVDLATKARILESADKLEPFVGSERATWFTNEIEDDPEYPGGKVTRTAVVDGSCVFLNRKGRGCLLHSFCLTEGRDYHELKPMISAIFPVTYGEGMLYAAEEIDDQTLVCRDKGVSLYEGARHDLLYYFGAEMIAELDSLATRHKAKDAARQTG